MGSLQTLDLPAPFPKLGWEGVVVLGAGVGSRKSGLVLRGEGGGGSGN